MAGDRGSRVLCVAMFEFPFSYALDLQEYSIYMYMNFHKVLYIAYVRK